MATRTRKKKAESAPEPAAFVVGEPESPVVPPEDEEPPTIRPETIDGLVSLRSHLETRVPGGLLWPLQKLPSMSQHLSDLESATDAVDSLAIRHAMSRSKLAELRMFLLSDAYAFGYLVCQHRDMYPEVHMAMCYASAGQAGKLAWFLTQSGFDGYVLDSYREACRSRGIDVGTIDGVYKLDRALDWQDQRWPRGVFKSSTITHTGATLTATADPNTTAKVTCAIDDKAFELLEQIGSTVTSGIYIDLFEDRVPKNSRDYSKSHVTLQGRTISHPQTCIQGGGYIGKDIGGHYDRFWTDDLVVRGPRGNATPAALPGVRKWLSGMRGYFMLSPPSGRIRRVHVGTAAIEGDDFHWLREKERSKRVISVCIPIETYPDGEIPKTLLQRGTPTMPTFLPPERIAEIQADVFTNEDESEGLEDWLCDYLLKPAALGGRMFSDVDLNDGTRSWSGPFEHPKARTRNGEKFKKQFLLTRPGTDDKGNPTTLVLCPWEDMDVIVTVASTWQNGARDWAVTASGVDSKLVRHQLETRTGKDGVEGWTVALTQMCETYTPRIIGLDHDAYKDDGIQNKLKTDTHLRSIARRMTSVHIPRATQSSRIRASVAEPFGSHQLLLLPKCETSTNDFGYAATRKEMLRFRADAEIPSPILESLAMVDALMRRPLTREDRERIEKQRRDEAKNAQPRMRGVAA